MPMKISTDEFLTWSEEHLDSVLHGQVKKAISDYTKYTKKNKVKKPPSVYNVMMVVSTLALDAQNIKPADFDVDSKMKLFAVMRKALMDNQKDVYDEVVSNIEKFINDTYSNGVARDGVVNAKTSDLFIDWSKENGINAVGMFGDVKALLA